MSRRTLRERKFLNDFRRYEGFECRSYNTPEQRMESATNWLLILVVAVAVGVAAVWVWT